MLKTDRISITVLSSSWLLKHTDANSVCPMLAQNDLLDVPLFMFQKLEHFMAKDAMNWPMTPLRQAKIASLVG